MRPPQTPYKNETINNYFSTTSYNDNESTKQYGFNLIARH